MSKKSKKVKKTQGIKARPTRLAADAASLQMHQEERKKEENN
jgi:hypothetical protein